jgi:hypothetical protein
MATQNPPTEIRPLFATIPTTHYAAIGKVVANWAAFEHLIESALWVLAQIDDEPAACLTAQIPNMARRFDALLALLRLHGASEEIIKEINKFVDATHALTTKRNRVAHDAWHWEFKTQRALRLEISAQKRLVYGFTAMPEEEVEEVVEEIASHIDDFDALMRRVFSSLPLSSLRGRPR